MFFLIFILLHNQQRKRKFMLPFFLCLRYFAKLKKLRGIFYFDSAPELQIRLINYIRNFS